jgi:hypothetical protein
MLVNRKELQAFFDDLKRECRLFIQEHLNEMWSVLGKEPTIS